PQQRGRGRHAIRVGRDQKAAQAAAELRQVGALAGRGQQQLANHLRDVSLVPRALGLARRGIDPEWKRVVVAFGHHVPAPRVWFDRISTTPCVAPLPSRQRPTLSSVSDLSPGEVWCSAWPSHCTRTHGLAWVPRRYEKPRIVKPSVPRSTNWPSALTRLFEVDAVTIPPCGHCILVVMVKNGGAITSPPSRRRSR